MLFASLLGIFMVFMPAISYAQKGKGKVPSPSNIETAAHVGKYKVELGVMRF